MTITTIVKKFKFQITLVLSKEKIDYMLPLAIWTFISSTDYIPGLMESLTAVMELNTRLKEEVV